MNRAMALRHRLDVVVNLREREEQRALELLGEAVRLTAARVDALRAAEVRARRDGRSPGPVEQWMLDEAAHRKALEEVKGCAELLARAREAESVARAKHLEAYKQAEVIRRLAETRKREILEAAEKREAKALDEIASQRHHRKG